MKLSKKLKESAKREKLAKRIAKNYVENLNLGLSSDDEEEIICDGHHLEHGVPNGLGECPWCGALLNDEELSIAILKHPFFILKKNFDLINLVHVASSSSNKTFQPVRVTTYFSCSFKNFNSTPVGSP